MSNQRELVASPAAEFVGGHEYLLQDILVLLPAKSLTRFKLVSKHWLSQISDPQFVLDYFRRKSPTGMFLRHKLPRYDSLNSTKFVPFNILDSTKFVPFNDLDQTRIPSLDFLKNNRSININSLNYDIEIRQSCNGLLLCLVAAPVNPPNKKLPASLTYTYCVCNPSTKQLRLLPRGPDRGELRRTSVGVLAFDPSISIHYKVICVRNDLIEWLGRRISCADDFVLDIYSSEDNSWRVFTAPFRVRNWCVWCYFNGAIYGLDECKVEVRGEVEDKGEEYYICFDVNAEKITRIRSSSPPRYGNYFCRYFDETGSCLRCPMQDKVSAMDYRILELIRDSTDSCKWITWKEVSFSTLMSAYPQFALTMKPLSLTDVDDPELGVVVEGVNEEESNLKEPSSLTDLRYRNLCIIEGPKEGEAAVVLAIPGKVISYNFMHKTVDELSDLQGDTELYHFRAFPYMESLFTV